MAFADKLKAKAVDLGLADKAAQAKEKAAVLADKNRDKIAGAVDKAGSTVNAKTGGKHADKIAKAKGAALKGVDKLAEQRSTEGLTQTTSPIDRAIGADAGAGVAGTSESAAERAIGADAPSVDMGRNENL